MPKACELKKGSIVEINREPHIVEELQVQTPSARGGATLYKFRFRSLVSKQKVDQSLRGDDMLRNADFERRPVQYSYSHGDTCVFTDLENYAEISLSAADLEDERAYLTEEMEGIHAMVSDGRVLGIELPPVAELTVTSCDPSMRGASATARTKPATLSTGFSVQVPEYLEQGETIRVDTRTGKFVSRA